MNTGCNGPAEFSVVPPEPSPVRLRTLRQERVAAVAARLAQGGMPVAEAAAAAETAQKLVEDIEGQKVFDNPMLKSSL